MNEISQHVPAFRTATGPPEEGLAQLGPEELAKRYGTLLGATDPGLALLPLHELLETLMDRVRAALATDTATVLLCSDGSVLRVRASLGLEEEVRDGVEIPIGKGISGTVAVRREAVIVDDVRRVPVVSPALHRLHSMMVAPLVVEGDLLGVFHTGTLGPRTFADADLHFFRAVADRVALSIRSALLHDRTREVESQRDRAEGALRESESRFRLLVESVVDYGIFLLDTEGRITSWNRGAERINGYAEEEVLGRHFSLFYTPEDVERDHPRWELEVVVREGRYEEEGWRVRRDGSRFWANVVITALRAPDGELVGFAKVTRDLTERKRAEAEREEILARERAARREAEEASRAKSEFLAVMSHELRTPLNAVIGYTDLLHVGIPEPLSPAVLRQLDRIGGAARHLLLLIEEILTFSRIETAAEEVRPLPTNVAEVVEESVELVRPVAEHKGLSLSVRATGGPLVLETDRGKLGQVLAHLLSNAVKFTPRGEVRVEAERVEDGVEVRVRDTGVGIAPEHLEKVFEPFWQVQQGNTREVGGMGLGLAVSQRLAHLLGGHLRVESIPGEGSVFTLRLPLRAPAHSVAERAGGGVA